MNVALLHDYLIRLGGAEKVFLNLRRIFPKAAVYTLLYDEKVMGRYFQDTEVHTSFLQRMPWSTRHYRWLAPLMPSAAESIDLREFDLVISSSSCFIKGLVLRPKTVHICYCHNPARFLWDYSWKYGRQKCILKKVLMHYLRLWDQAAANRVDHFIANSRITAQRISKYYQKRAQVIYPPVDIWKGQRAQTGRAKTWEYFLIVSQLTPYKRIDLAIDAFNKLELPLVIVGQGRDGRRLRRLAGPTVEMPGWQPDDSVQQYMQNCTAFVFPGEDDFGIAPVEAMSFGKPVLAFRRGGALETVVEGVTGEFFDDLVSESLADGVRRLRMNLDQYSPDKIQARAAEFSQDRFERSIKEFVIKILEKRKR